MDDKILNIHPTEIRGGKFCFSPWDECEERIKFIRRFAKFIGESQTLVLDVEQYLTSLDMEGVSPEDGRVIEVRRIVKVEKVSRWTLLDRICYLLWVPWGIRQKYIVHTKMKERYVLRFGEQGAEMCRQVEAALHDEQIVIPQS